MIYVLRQSDLTCQNAKKAFDFFVSVKLTASLGGNTGNRRNFRESAFYVMNVWLFE